MCLKIKSIVYNGTRLYQYNDTRLYQYSGTRLYQYNGTRLYQYSGTRLYQYNEPAFLFMLWVFTSFFRTKILQVIKEKLFQLTASLCFHFYAYPHC